MSRHLRRMLASGRGGSSGRESFGADQRLNLTRAPIMVFVSFIVGLAEGASQELSAHGECLRRVINHSVPMPQPENE